MAILKIIAFVLLIMFAMTVFRIALSVFRFLRLVKKVRGTTQEQSRRSQSAGRESAHEPKSSRDGKTITLGKDDYHVD